MEVEQIAKILIKDPRSIPNYITHKLGNFLANFRGVIEGTRKDIALYYSIMDRKPKYDEIYYSSVGQIT